MALQDFLPINTADQAAKGYATGLKFSREQEQYNAAKEQARRAALQQQQMNADLDAVYSNPTQEGIAGLMIKYPSISEGLKRGFDALGETDTKQALSVFSQAYVPFMSGNTEVGISVLNENIKALENSGRTNEANSLKAIRTLAETDPKAAAASLGMAIASKVPNQFSDIHKSIGAEKRAEELQPSAISQAEATAEKTQLENEWLPKTKQAEISNIESQIEDRTTGRVLENKKIENQNTQFYANLDQGQKQFLMKLSQDERKIANELNPTKPEKPEDRIARLSKVEDFDSAVIGAKNSAKMAEDMANNYSQLSDSTGGYWNKLWRNIPGSDEKSFAQNLETLKSQIFLSQVNQMKGMGALTDQEGARLEKSIASLDPDLDPKTLQKNLRSISSELNRAAVKAQKMAELYATRGTGYSDAVVQAAKKRGVTPYEMQKIANEMGY